MAKSEVQIAPVATTVSPSVAHHERIVRRVCCWLTLCFLFQGQLGATWDREWHAYVGRDWFWTPPHILIYSCVSGAGLIALGMVLQETLRYYRGASGVDDSSTIRIFRFFHAPLGFTVTGFGAFIALAAAPLDNYWHELYGIDIALWAPFHMMGVTGAFIGSLGVVYVFASEAAIQRQEVENIRTFLGFTLLEWGALMTIAGLLNLTLTGFLQFPIITIGLLQIPTYFLPAVACGALCMVAATRMTQKPGAATTAILLLFVFTFATELFVPWAIRTAVAQQGLLYRIPGRIPYFRTSDAVMPLFYLLSALMVDGFAYWRQQHSIVSSKRPAFWLLGVVITIPELIIAPCIIMWNPNVIDAFLNEPGTIIPLALKPEAALLAVPVILLAGALGASWGVDFGDIWRWNRR